MGTERSHLTSHCTCLVSRRVSASWSAKALVPSLGTAMGLKSATQWELAWVPPLVPQTDWVSASASG